ncbi:hypothetical protein [Sutcliffiella sp. NC1]|nr:hypothetical protein [Sutcliffiella sp. NC1]WBL15228.1 hypothetical protein O1A01_00625 [Sutcliffiella sp. NC1]
MHLRRRPKRIISSKKPGGFTRIIGKTKIQIENEKALTIIRSIKGMFG